MTVERYRGFKIERHHTGPWDVTYQWSLEPWDLGDPIGYEPSIAACKRGIDDELYYNCRACKGSGEVRVDPFEPETAPCPDCKEHHPWPVGADVPEETSHALHP